MPGLQGLGVIEEAGDAAAGPRAYLDALRRKCFEAATFGLPAD